MGVNKTLGEKLQVTCTSWSLTPISGYKYDVIASRSHDSIHSATQKFVLFWVKTGKKKRDLFYLQQTGTDPQQIQPYLGQQNIRV